MRSSIFGEGAMRLPVTDGGFCGVCSYGRSGSSVLMKALSRAGFCIVGDMPYEDRSFQIAYFREHDILRVGEADFDFLYPDITRPEFSHYYTQIAPLWREDGNALNELTSWYKDALASNKIVVEKCIGFSFIELNKRFRASHAVKFIQLVRDPRDIFLSVKNFNIRRGFKSFNENESDIALFEIIIDFLKAQISFAERESSLLVRYEDLMIGDVEIVQNILTFVDKSCSSERNLEAFITSLKPTSTAEFDHITKGSRSSYEKFSVYSDYSGLFSMFADDISKIGYLD